MNRHTIRRIARPRAWRAMTLALVMLATSLAWLIAAAPTEAAPLRDPSSCSDLDPKTGLALSTRIVTPNQVRVCESAVVSVTVRVSCEGMPLHIMLVIDRSGSMTGQPIRDVKTAARALVDALELDRNPNVKVGIVSHGGRPTTDLRLTNSVASVRGKIASLDVRSTDFEDNLPAAITEGKNQLVRERSQVPVPPVDVMVVLSDGGQTFPPAQAVQAANNAKGQDILVVAVCIENGTAGGCAAMRQMASSSRYYFESRGTSGLTSIFRSIAADVQDIFLRTLKVVETLPDGLDYVDDSLWPEEGIYDATARTLTWDMRFISRDGFPFEYRVKPSAVTTYTLASKSEVSFRDTRGGLGEMSLPTAVLTITEPCVPPPVVTSEVPATETPTPTNTPTNTPTQTPTNTPTNTPSNTPTNTPSPTPAPVYLPILNLRRCLERDIPVDIVLIVDASTSMLSLTQGGRPRIEAAQEGAHGFVARMRRADNVAVVAFNDKATLMSGLTGDRAQLEAAIDAIETAPFTRIDLALDAARVELSSERARPEAKKVVLLMTDGQPTNTTPAQVRAAGDRARELATVFVIGVGGDIDRELMVDVAGGASQYYAVDDAEALGKIYGLIAERTVCESP